MFLFLNMEASTVHSRHPDILKEYLSFSHLFLLLFLFLFFFFFLFILENNEIEPLFSSSPKEEKTGKMKKIAMFTVGGVCVIIPILILFIVLSGSSPTDSTPPCSLPPSLITNYTFYVTYHDYPHIQHFNSNGSFLETLPSPDSKNIQLRGMILTSNQEFLVANGDADNSVIFGSISCGEKDYDVFANTKLAHPYGLGLGLNPNLVGDHPNNSTILYSSNQNSLEISFHVLHPDNSSVYGHDGVFGNPKKKFKQLRGLVVWEETWEVFVADEGSDEVVVFDQLGEQIGEIAVSAPIALYISKGVLYVSSNDNEFPAVYAYSLSDSLKRRSTTTITTTTTTTTSSLSSSITSTTSTTTKTTPTSSNLFELQTVFFTPIPQDFSHPVGIGSCGDDLLVLSQDNQNLLKFSISMGKYVGVVMSELKDAPEQILVLNCEPMEEE